MNYQKTSKTHFDFSTIGSARQVCLPINVEYLIPEDDPVRLIDLVLSEMDYASLNQTYSAEGRNPAVYPVTLFKVMVYAYSRGINSSREIEKACRRDLCFKYLLGAEKIPDHNTIARFRKNHLKYCIDDLFSQMIDILAANEEIRFENLFVDGTKIEANANKYTFVWQKATEKHMSKLQTDLRTFIEKELEIRLAVDIIDSAFTLRILKQLKNEIKRKHITFVYGKGRHKTELQRQYDKLAEYTERLEKYEYYLNLFDGRNSFSKTDTDATFMHMKEDHMRNSQLKPGYNVQVGVESEYIVGVTVSADRDDVNTLKPFLEKIKTAYGRTYSNLIADAGYESEENYTYLKQENIRSFIKPSDYEYSKTKKYQKAMEFRNSMEYDPETDTYTCKHGRRFVFEKVRRKKTGSGFVTSSRVYRCESCAGCPYLGKCYKGIHSKSIWVNEVFDAFRQESLKNITSDEGILLRVNRSIQAEGVFGITKQDMGFTRFLTRGNENVYVEYMLLAFGFDLNKLHSRIGSGRFGESLFIPEELANTA